MRTLEVPDEFPTDNIYELDMFIENRKEKINDYLVSEKTDNCEIVDVDNF